jgi:hypothetical protein
VFGKQSFTVPFFLPFLMGCVTRYLNGQIYWSYQLCPYIDIDNISLSPLCSITLLQPKQKTKKNPQSIVITVTTSSKHLLGQFINWATHSLVYSLLTYTTYILLNLTSCIRCTMDHCLVLYVVFWLRTGKNKNGQLKYIMNSLKIAKR